MQFMLTIDKENWTPLDLLKCWAEFSRYK